jgi:archaellin
MKKIMVIAFVIAAAVAAFIACNNGGSSDNTGIVRIIGDSN